MPGNHWLHRWTDAEDRIVLDPSLTRAEAAERLGRTEAAVASRRQQLRGTAGTYRHKHEVTVAAGRADWMIAKTCFGCERLLPAASYYRRPELQGSWSVKCKPCHNRESLAGLSRAQDKTRASAIANGEPWTRDEYIEALVSDLPVVEIASNLGRTYSATLRARQKARKWVMLAGEAATMLGIAQKQIRQWVREGKVAPVSGSTSYRIGDLLDAQANTAKARRRTSAAPA